MALYKFLYSCIVLLYQSASSAWMESFIFDAGNVFLGILTRF